MDWGTGEYEHTARQLLPAAEVTVGHLAPRVGEEVVDLGCGTGNATLLVARAGVDVISVGALTHSAPAADIALDLALSR